MLAVGDGEIAAARKSAALLARRTVFAEKLIVAGPEAVLAQLRQDDLFKAFEFVRIEKQSHDAAFACGIRRASGTGLLFVLAGALVPEAWDIRLFWTSQRYSGVATISPLTSPQAPKPHMSHDAIDEECYAHSQMNAITARPSPECILVAAESADATAWEWENSREAGCFGSFIEITSRLRFQHFLADHIYVDVSACRSTRSAFGSASASGSQAEPRTDAAGLSPAFRIGRLIAPRQLHVMHSWGGGLARWVTEFCRADLGRQNYLLKSIGDRDGFGRQLVLYRSAEDRQPIRRWILNPMIPATAIHHEGYVLAIQQLMLEFGIENIIVSSLIGHSLDILRTARPTAMVCHDFYPFCPALNITFDNLCGSCDRTRLTDCTKRNPHNRFFDNVPPPYWLDLRKEFLATVEGHSIPLVAPSESTAALYSQLLPALRERFRVIPHGTRSLKPAQYSERDGGKFRVLILGSLAVSKGLEIIKDIQAGMRRFADLFFVGCGSEGKQFENVPGVTVIREYRWEDLSSILSGIQPDLALLPSVVPETFSLTLQELFELRIPTLATRLGSFSDRIVDGVNGFLCEPTAARVLAAVQRLANRREALILVRSNLAATQHRTVTEMLRDYSSLLASPPRSSRSYFAPDTRESIRSGRFTRCQVFWRAADESFSESYSSSARYAPVAEPQLVTVQIQAMRSVPAVIRVDPAEAPGVLDLQRLTLRKTDGEIVWNWDGRVEEIAQAFFHVVPIGEPGSVALCFVNDDPHFELPLSESALAAIERGGTLEVEIHWHRIETSIEILENECAKPDHATSLEYLLDHLKKERNEAKGFETADRALIDIQAAEQRINDLENSLSWRITQPLRTLADGLDPLLRLVTARRR
jgi:glycosyltransferase involved in cell wall biosynthesis